MKRNIRKLKTLPISDFVMIDLLKMLDIGRSLPNDAEILDMHYDHNRAYWVLKIQSETFKEVKEGDKIPELNPLVVKNVQTS